MRGGFLGERAAALTAKPSFGGYGAGQVPVERFPLWSTGRFDSGKATARFDVGDVCEVISGALVRKSEDLESPQIAKLQAGAQVQVLRIGSGPTGKRLEVQNEAGIAGWVSVLSANGEEILEILQKAQQSTARQQPWQHAARPEESRPCARNGVPVKTYGVDMKIYWLERNSIERMLTEKVKQEGYPQLELEFLTVHDAQGNIYKPGEFPHEMLPEMFPLKLRYRPDSPPPPPPPKPSEMVMPPVTLQHRFQAMSHAQLQKVQDAERRMQLAIDRGDEREVARAAKAMQSLGYDPQQGMPLAHGKGTSWLPSGYEPLEIGGRMLAMHSMTYLVYEPPNFETPTGVFNMKLGKVEPVAGMSDEHPFTQITYFGRTYCLTKGGQVVDPDSEMVVGLANPETGQIEPCEPMALEVFDFLDRKGFKLELDTQKEDSVAPFVQILPDEPGPDRIQDELLMQPMEAGSWKALRNAHSTFRSDKERVLTAIESEEVRSWRMLLYASPKLREDREVILAAATQDLQALPYAADFYGDRAFMQEVVNHHGLALRYASEELRGDPDLVATAIRSSWRALEFASEALRGNRRIVMEAVQQSWQALEFASEELRDMVEVIEMALSQCWRAQCWKALAFAGPKPRSRSSTVLKAVVQHVDALQWASPELLADRAFVLEAVRLHGEALRFAHEFREDRDMVLEAIRRNWRALRYAAAELLHDKGVVTEAIRQHREALSLCPEEVRMDPELVLLAAGQRLDSLGSAPEALRDDLPFMIRAVGLFPMALQYASESLRANPELVLEAVKRNWRALRFAAPELLTDLSFMLRAVECDGHALMLTPPAMRSDPVLVCEAIERDPDMLSHASPILCADRQFMMEALALDGLTLRWASDELRGDREMVLTAVKNSGRALEFASPELQEDPDVVLEALRQDWEAIDCTAERLRNDLCFMLRAVRVQGMALKGASLQLQADPDLVLEAVRHDWRSLKFAARSLRANFDFMFKAVGANPLALALASDELRVEPELVAESAQAQEWALQIEEEDFRGCDQAVRYILRAARPGWSEADLNAAEQKLQVIGISTLGALVEALASDLNGRLRAAGQKIFTATTIMELRAKLGITPGAAHPAPVRATPASRPSRPNARVTF